MTKIFIRKAILAGLVFLVLGGLCSYVDAQEEEPGLVGWWKFNEGDLDLAKDSSGHGHAGKVHGATSSEGKFGKALDFDGQRNYVEIQNAPEMNPSKAITVAAWVYRKGRGKIDRPRDVPKNRTYDSTSCIISKRGAGSGWEIKVINSGSRERVVIFQINGTHGDLVISNQPIKDKQWNYVVARFDGTRLSLSVNGQETSKKMEPTTLNPNNNTVKIGAGITAGYYHFEGMIDEVMVCGRALTDEEVISHYNRGLTLDQRFELKGRAYPVEYGREYAYLLNGVPNSLQFYIWGDVKSCPASRLILEVPEWIEAGGAWAGGAFGWAGTHSAVQVTKEKTQREGLSYSRYTLNLNRKYVRSKYRGVCHGIFLEPKDQRQKECKIYWHLASEDRRGEEKVIVAKILPRLVSTANPKRFEFSVWESYHWQIPDEKTWDKLMSLYREVGIKGFGSGRCRSRELMDRLKAHGCWNYSDIGGVTTRKVLVDKRSPRQLWQQDKSGRERKFSLCPSYVMGEGRAVVLKKWQEEVRKELVEANEVYQALWDYEPQRIMNGCFCPRCLKSFSEKFGFAVESLKTEKILRDHRKEWLEFREWQLAEAVKMFAEVIRSTRPGTKVLLCNRRVYRPEEIARRENHGNITLLFDRYVDAHYSMMYFHGQGFYNRVDYTVMSLKKPVIPILITMEYAAHYRADSPRDIRLDILAAVTAGAKGTVFYAGMNALDGEYLTFVDRAGMEIASIEDFLMDGQRDDSLAQLEEGSDILAHAHRLAKSYCLELFNYTSKEIPFHFSLPDVRPGKYTLFDPVDSKVLIRGSNKHWTEKELKKGLTYIIPARDAKFLVLAPYQESRQFRGVIREEQLKAKYEASLSEREDIRKGNLEIGWSDSDGDGTKEVFLKSPHQTVWVSLRGARVWRWLIAKGERELVVPPAEFDRPGLFGDLFWSPRIKTTEETGYQVVSRDILEHKARVVLATSLDVPAVKGLGITKTYTIDEEGRWIEVRWEITNSRDNALEISFWTRNQPQLGRKELDKQKVLLVDGTKWVVPSIAGVEQYGRPSGDNPNVFHQAERLKENWVAVYCPLTREAIKVDIDKEKLEQTYSCWVNPPTMEWIYKSVTLKPGEYWKSKVKLKYLEEVDANDIGKR